MTDRTSYADLLRPGCFIKTAHGKIGKVLDDNTVRFEMDTRASIPSFGESLTSYKIKNTWYTDPVMEVRYPTKSFDLPSNYWFFDRMTIVWTRNEFIKEILDPGDIIIYKSEPYVYVQDYSETMISLIDGMSSVMPVHSIDKGKVSAVYRPRYWIDYKDYDTESRLIFKKEADQ